MHTQSSTSYSLVDSAAHLLLMAGLLLALLLSGSASPAFAYGLASISITDTSLAEGDSGASNMIFTLTRSGDTSSTVMVRYITEDGSAVAGVDYMAQTGTVIFALGVTTATVAVPILGNTINQNNRSFTLNLTGVTNYYGPPATLAAKSDFTTGFGPVSVAEGDVNGDGKPDLAVVNSNINSISLLLNTTAAGAATASFATKSDFTTGSHPYSVAMGDVNGDGKPDLAVANRDGASVSLLLNTTAAGAATASFATKSDFAAGSQPHSVAMGDVNGDGKPDLAVANFLSHSVSLLLNTTAAGAATASFADKSDFATDSGPLSVALGDVNGDGKPDLAVANRTSTSVSLLLNTTAAGATTASFAAKSDFITGSRPVSVAFGDVNGDGKSDLTTANFDSASVSLLLNTTAAGAATASFAAKSDFPTGASPVSVALGDVNGDGKPDLAVTNFFSATVSLLLNTTAAGATTASFSAKGDFITGSRPYSVALGDVNGDGKPDLAVTNFFSNSVSLLLNTTVTNATPPSFSAKSDFTTGNGNGPLSVAKGDVNGDGKSDLAIANHHSANVSLLLNTTAAGAATTSFAVRKDLTAGNQPNSVAVGDVNGDGKPDLVVANQNSNSVSLLLNTTAAGAATASFAVKSDFITGVAPTSVALGDVNRDGMPDLAIANLGSDSVSLLLNTTAAGATTASFAAKSDFTTGAAPTSVAMGDVNGDGKPDLAVANRDSASVSLLLNTTAAGAGAASFATQSSFSTGNRPFSVALGDVNGDGRPDLAVANSDSNSASVLLNTTAAGAVTASFSAKSDFITGSRPVSVALGDVNGDGKADLTVANSNSTSVSLLLNTAPAGAITANFAAKSDFITGSRPFSVVLGDINGDGKPDLAVANYSSASVSLLLNLAATITPATATGTIIDDDYALSVSKVGTGSGSVSSIPAGGICGGDCNAIYSHGTVVTLTASADVGSTFTGWSGSGCAGTGPCMVTMTNARAVTATFTLNNYLLTVSKAGTGSGVVSSNPAGVACGGGCDESYSHGTTVTLIASADVGSTFIGWSGDDCAGTGPCMMTMTNARAVTATFTLNNYLLAVSKAGTGSGTVSSKPAGVSCGGGCDKVYSHGTAVTLTASADVSSTFTGWSGDDCAGTGTCMVTMTNARAVTATFDLLVSTPITFLKTVVGGPAQPGDWTFSVVGGTGGITHTEVVILVSGVYTVLEGGPSGYAVSGAGDACSVVNGQVRLSVGAEAATCAITNTKTDLDATPRLYLPVIVRQ